MELNLRSLFGLHVHSCPPPPLPHLGAYTRARLVSKDRRHLFVTPWSKQSQLQEFKFFCGGGFYLSVPMTRYVYSCAVKSRIQNSRCTRLVFVKFKINNNWAMLAKKVGKHTHPPKKNYYSMENTMFRVRIRKFLGLSNQGSEARILIRILSSSSKNSKKNLYFCCFVTSL
jgi:hypothetical protein